MARAKPYKTHRHIFRYISADGTVLKFPCKCRDGTETVRIFRTREDVIRGVPGMACACADMQTVHRTKPFKTHECKGFIEFTHTQCYVVDKVNKAGHPISCVRYRHDDTTIPKFDVKGGKQKLLRSIECERWITLRPRAPSEQKPHNMGLSRTGNRDGSRTPIRKLSRGAELRFLHSPACEEYTRP